MWFSKLLSSRSIDPNASGEPSDGQGAPNGEKDSQPGDVKSVSSLSGRDDKKVEYDVEVEDEISPGSLTLDEGEFLG